MTALLSATTSLIEKAYCLPGARPYGRRGRATLAWGRYVGLDGAMVGLDRSGASAPYQVLYQKLGLTAEAVAEAACGVLERVEQQG